MADKVIKTIVQEGRIENFRVRITTKLHTKNPEGLRTIRVEYLDNMPNRHGSWYAGTVTERVISGPSNSIRTHIQEHRVA